MQFSWDRLGKYSGEIIFNFEQWLKTICRFEVILSLFCYDGNFVCEAYPFTRHHGKYSCEIMFNLTSSSGGDII